MAEEHTVTPFPNRVAENVAAAAAPVTEPAPVPTKAPVVPVRVQAINVPLPGGFAIGPAPKELA